MRDKTFLKIALAWSIIGIFLLILIANYTAPPELNIIELGENMGKTVVVDGIVDKTTYKKEVSFIDLKDSTGKITVVLFDNPAKKVYANDEIKVKGKISEYKGELEIIADEIFCVKCLG